MNKALQAYLKIRKLKVGSQYLEPALAKKFKMSRTPLREALVILQAQGYVKLTPRLGMLVIKNAKGEELDTTLDSMSYPYEWTSVDDEDKLPALGIDVIVGRHDSDVMAVASLKLFNNYNIWTFRSTNSYPSLENSYEICAAYFDPTHWHPLPRRPKAPRKKS